MNRLRQTAEAVWAIMAIHMNRRRDLTFTEQLEIQRLQLQSDLIRRYHAAATGELPTEPFEALRNVRLTDYSKEDSSVETNRRYYEVDTATRHQSNASNAVWRGEDYWRVTYYPAERNRYTDSKDFVVVEFPERGFPTTIAITWDGNDLDDGTRDA